MATPAYVMAHRELPQRFFDGPHELIELLAGPRGGEVLTTVWQELGGKGESPTAEVIDLDGGNQLVVVTIPAARDIGEAALVAVVADDERAEYYTLEHSVDLGDGPATMLCQRDRTGRHLNHGLGPAARPKAFARAVLARLRKRPA